MDVGSNVEQGRLQMAKRLNFESFQCCIQCIACSELKLFYLSNFIITLTGQMVGGAMAPSAPPIPTPMG